MGNQAAGETVQIKCAADEAAKLMSLNAVHAASRWFRNVLHLEKKRNADGKNKSYTDGDGRKSKRRGLIECS